MRHLARKAACLKGGKLIDFKKAIVTFIVLIIPFNVLQTIPITSTSNSHLAPISNVKVLIKKGREKRNEVLNSPYDGALIHYQVRGNPHSPNTIFALHGLSAGPSHWNKFLEENPLILKRFRVILPAVRGHGWLGRRSQLGDLDVWNSRRKGEKIDPAKYYVAIAEDLRAIKERENVQSAIFIGHSMGGDISRYYYSRYPKDVDALILVSSFARYPFYGNLILRHLYPLVRTSTRKLIQLTPVIQALERATNYLANHNGRGFRFSARLVANRILFNKIDPQIFNQFLTLTLSAHVGALLLAITAMGNNSNGYSKIDIPTLVVQGIGDGLIFGKRANGEFSRRIPHAKLYELKGRHFPHLHDERFPGILKDFLESVYPGSLLNDVPKTPTRQNFPPNESGSDSELSDGTFSDGFPLISIRLSSFIAVEKSI